MIYTESDLVKISQTEHNAMWVIRWQRPDGSWFTTKPIMCDTLSEAIHGELKKHGHDMCEGSRFGLWSVYDAVESELWQSGYYDGEG